MLRCFFLPMNSRKRLFLFLSWTLFIMVIMGTPGGYIPKPIGILSLLSPDKIVHLLLFAPLSVFLLSYLHSLNYNNTFTNNAVIWVLFYGIVYAILTELLQFYVFIGRNGNLYDTIADILGTVLGIIIFNKWIKKKK